MKGQTLLIGSGAPCDVQMRSVEVAPRHCLISRSARDVTVRAMDAHFPVRVNGVAVVESPLRHGDKLAIGPFELSISVEFPPSANIPPVELPKPEVVAASTETLVSAEESARVKKLLGELAAREIDLAKRVRAMEAKEEQLRSRESAIVQHDVSAVVENFKPTPAEATTRRLEQLARVRQKLAAKLQQIRKHAGQSGGADPSLLMPNATVAVGSSSELADRSSELLRRERELARDRFALEQLREDVLRKEKSLERQREDLEERKARLAEEELSCKRSRSELLDQSTRAEKRLIEIDQFASLAEAKRRGQEKEDERLARLSNTLEQQSAELSKLERDLSTRDHESKTRTLELDERQHLLDQREAELKNRATALEAAEQEGARESRKLQLERESLAQSRADLHRSEMEFADQSKRSAEKWDADLLQIRQDRAQLDSDRKDLDLLRASIVESKELLVGKLAETQAQAIDLAEREAILDHQQKDQRQRNKLLEETAVAQQQKELDLEQRRQSVELEAMMLKGRESETKHLSEQLESLRNELHGRKLALDEREQQANDRERSWLAQIERKRTEVDRSVDDATKRTALLDRQASAQRRQVERLRELGHRVSARKRTIDQEFHELARSHERDLSSLHEWMAVHQRSIEEIVSVAKAGSELANEANHHLSTAKQVGRETSALRATLLRNWRSLLTAVEMVPTSMDAHSAGNLLREVANNVRGLKDQFAKFDAWFESREVELARNDQWLHRYSRLVAELKEISERPLPKSSVPMALGDTVAVASEVTTRKRSELEKQLLELQLVPRDIIESESQRAEQFGRSLEQQLLLTGAITPFQIDAIRNGQPGKLVLGPTVIMDVLHRGVMATTYRVRHPAHARPVTLRILDARWCRDTSLFASYDLSQKGLAGFSHPAVLRVLGPISIDGRLGVFREYVAGQSLADLTLSVPMASELVRHCVSVIQAVMHANRAGFMHLSLRPSRILIDENGEAKVFGFGEPAWMTKIHRCEKGRAVGVFVPPELLHGEAVDFRADLFSIGQIFLEMSATSNLFESTRNARETDWPKGFLDFLLQLTAEEPAKRAHSMEEVLEIAEAFLVDPVVSQAHDRRAA